MSLFNDFGDSRGTGSLSRRPFIAPFRTPFLKGQGPREDTTRTPLSTKYQQQDQPGNAPTPFPTPSSSIQSTHSTMRGLDQTLYGGGGEGRRTVSRDFNSIDGTIKQKAGAFARSAAKMRSAEPRYEEGYDEMPNAGSYGYRHSIDGDPVITGDIDLDISMDRGRRTAQRALRPIYNDSQAESRYSTANRDNPYQLSDNDCDEPDDLPRQAPLKWFSQLVPPLDTHSSQRHQASQPGQDPQGVGGPVARSPMRTQTQTQTRRRGPTTASGILLEPVANLPDKYRGMFSFPFFNAAQSQCFNLAFRADRNLVVSAPTGSGKTCIMELAIVRLMSQPGGENAKVIYIAPTKALCNERTKDWQQKFRVLGITCNELTGDTDNVRVNDIRQSNIIVTTPEKWDSMTRRWRDYKNLMALLRLILIDECHILNEAERGATLEVVVSRMRTVNVELRNDRTKTPAGCGQDMRFVALSATAPNIADIAAWLKDAQGAPADVRVFGEEYRPVQLRKEVLSYYSNSSNYFQFDTILDSKLMEVIEKFSNCKPTLIFCCTRRSVTAAAERLARQCAEIVHTTGTYGPTHPFVKTRDQSQRLRDMQSQLTDKKLKELVVHGVAFHNGGLSSGDRHLIETAFLSGHLSVICATSTLAVGVNLPAHLVIIKGTMQYNGTECTPYSEFDITQMLGRAGRPQFDDSGAAVIMTDMQNVRTYQDMVTGKQVIESNLHENLIEHLNSEVVLGAVQSTKSAFDWLRSSFLYVRMRKNPAHYKLKNCTHAAGKLSAEQRLESICLRDLELLKEHGIMTMSPESGNLKATEIGESMARYYIKFATAVTVLKMRPKAGLADALETLCRAEEFSEIRFRGDKTQLNTLNKDRSIRFPVSGKIGRIDQKINVLIQCHLASISLSDQKSHLALEATTIMMQAPRIARFMAEVCATKGDALSLYSAINLCRCLLAKTWENSPFLLKQIESVGPATAKMLATAGICTFDKLALADPRSLEVAVNRNPPFGNKVQDLASLFPRLSLQISQFKDLARPMEVELFVNAGLSNGSVAKTYGKKGPVHVSCIVSLSDHTLVDYRRIPMSRLKDGESFRVRVRLTSPTQKIMCTLVNEETAGLDVRKEIVPDIRAVHFVHEQIKNSRKPRQTDLCSSTQNVINVDDATSDEFGDDILLDDSQFEALTSQATEFVNTTSSSRVSQQKSKTAAPTQRDKYTIHNLCITSSDDDDTGMWHTAPIGGATARQPVSRSQLPAKKHGPTHALALKATQGLPAGHVSCAHRCKSKESCAHECCKTGIPLVQARKRKKKLPAVVTEPVVPTESADQSGWTDTSSDFEYSAPTKPKTFDALMLPSDKTYDEAPLSASLAQTFRDVFTSSGTTSTNSQPPLRVPSTPLAMAKKKADNLSARTPTRPAVATFIDAEASQDGYLSDSSFLSEQEGEFDGFIVDDDEPEEYSSERFVDGKHGDEHAGPFVVDDDQLEDYISKRFVDEHKRGRDAAQDDIIADEMDLSSEESVTRNRRTRKRTLITTPSSELGIEPAVKPEQTDPSFFNDSPLQKKRRTSVQNTHTLDNAVGATAAAASATHLPPSSIRSETRPKPVVPSSRKTTTTSRQPWKDDPFAFDHDHPVSGSDHQQQQPLQVQLGALNRLHERTATQSGGVVPSQVLQTSRLRQRGFSGRSGSGVMTGDNDGQCRADNKERRKDMSAAAAVSMRDTAASQSAYSESRANLSRFISGLRVKDHAAPLQRQSSGGSAHAAVGWQTTADRDPPRTTLTTDVTAPKSELSETQSRGDARAAETGPMQSVLELFADMF
ncbi:Sec63 [Geranomyces variabilis]|nr:Sec63 [Geranomyces variabilis]